MGTPDESTNLPHLVLQPLEGVVQYKTEDIQNVPRFYHYTPDAIVCSALTPIRIWLRRRKDMPGASRLRGYHQVNLALRRSGFNGAAGIKIFTYVLFKGTGDLVAAAHRRSCVSMAMSYVTPGDCTKSTTRACLPLLHR
jgi:hypothetical protein